MDGFTVLRRGALTTSASNPGDQAAPGSGATITIWSSASNASGQRGGARFKRLVLNLYSSHASATNGVVFAESNDGGTTWRTLTEATLATTTYTKYDVAVSAPAVRVTFENSASTITTWEMSLLGDTCERAAAA